MCVTGDYMSRGCNQWNSEHVSDWVIVCRCVTQPRRRKWVGCERNSLSRDTQISRSSVTSSSATSSPAPRRSQTGWETKFLQVPGVPQDLLLMGQTQNSSRGRHPSDIRNRCPNHLSWFLFDVEEQWLYSEPWMKMNSMNSQTCGGGCRAGSVLATQLLPTWTLKSPSWTTEPPVRAPCNHGLRSMTNLVFIRILIKVRQNNI